MTAIVEPAPEERPDSRLLGSVEGVLKNAAFYYVGGAVSALSRLVIVALIARSVGAEGYGLYAAVLALTMYAELLDLGLRPGVMKWVAESRACGLHDFANRRLSSVFAFYLVMAGLMTLAGFALYRPFIAFFNVAPAMHDAARWVLVFLFIEMSLRFPLALFNGILWGSHRLDLSSVVTIATTVVRVALVVLALVVGGGLVGISVSMALATLVWLVLLMTLARTAYPELRLGLRHVSFSHIADSFHYTWPVFIAGIGIQIAYNTDALVIGHFLDIEKVGLYTIAFQLYSFLTLAVFRGGDTLFPVYAARHKVLGKGGVRPWYLSAVRLTFAAAAFAALLLALYGRPVIDVWAGEGKFVGTPTMLVLAGILALDSSVHVSGTLLLSIGRPRMIALAYTIGGVANLGLSIALVQVIGVVGVVLGTLVTEGALSAALIVGYACRVLHIDARRFLREATLPGVTVMIPAGALAAAFWRLGLATNPSLVSLALQGTLLGLLWLAAAWLWVLSPRHRASASALVFRIGRRTDAQERSHA
ncbi:MAG: oligosaccharide flippase family protein [Dehalococcoidia bacterium]|jgi:O-antigen/teichoic acid export membrane protein